MSVPFPPVALSAFEPDWAGVSRKLANQPWAGAVLAALRDDHAAWRRRLSIPGPERTSQRIHTYFCDADGAKLRFDPERPHCHVCPVCGQVRTGEPWDGAWVMQMHNAAASQLERAAVLLRTGGETDAAVARATLEEIAGHYAEKYPDYPVHGDRPGQEGRVQPHRLNEAVWVNSLLRSLRWSGLVATFSPARQEQLKTLARLAVELLRPQVNAIHNHHTWMLAALAECAVLLQDEALLGWCRDFEFGMDAQLREGFREDGLWYEGSVTYQYYTLESVLAYREAAGRTAFSGDDWARKLVRAVNHPPRLAYADGRMPAYADGWLDTFLGDFAHVAEYASGLLGREVDVAAYRRDCQPRRVRLMTGGPAPDCGDRAVADRASVAALLHGPEILASAAAAVVPPLVLLEPSGFAVLRNEAVRLAVRFGADGGFHDHRDKLNVDLETASGWRSLDLGTSGYGSDFTQWLRSPVAHNLLVVDGERQSPHTGCLVSASAREITVESAYAGRLFRRSLSLQPDGWHDDYSATLEAVRQLDWVFHGDGLFVPEGESEAAGLEDADGVRWLRNVRRLAPTARLRGSWTHGEAVVSLQLEVPEGFSVYWAEAPGNADGRPLGVVVIRGRAASAHFAACFTVA